MLGAVDFDFKANLESRRERLIARLDAYATGSERIILVFDAPKGKLSKTKIGKIEVIFAPKPGGADSYIEKVAAKSSNATIVTSDRELINTSAKKGIYRRSPQRFWSEWENTDLEYHPVNRRVDLEERMKAKESENGNG